MPESCSALSLGQLLHPGIPTHAGGDPWPWAGGGGLIFDPCQSAAPVTSGLPWWSLSFLVCPTRNVHGCFGAMEFPIHWKRGGKDSGGSPAFSCLCSKVMPRHGHPDTMSLSSLTLRLFPHNYRRSPVATFSCRRLCTSVVWQNSAPLAHNTVRNSIRSLRSPQECAWWQVLSCRVYPPWAFVVSLRSRCDKLCCRQHLC